MAEIPLAFPNTRGRRVGAVIIDESPRHLNAERTATGFNLTIPAAVGLKSAHPNEPRLVLKDLHLIISLRNNRGANIELGQLHDYELHTAYISDRELTEETKEANQIWRASFPALGLIERARGDKPPRLHIALSCQLSYIVICAHWPSLVRPAQTPPAAAGSQRPSDKPKPQLFTTLTDPQQVNSKIDITYPLDVWESMVQKVLSDAHDDPFLMLSPLASFLAGKKPS